MDGEGAGARSAAEIAVFTASAAAVERAGADRLEQGMVAVDVDDALALHVAERDGQESRRPDVAVMRDEDDALAVARPRRLRERGPARGPEAGDQLAREPAIQRAE